MISSPQPARRGHDGATNIGCLMRHGGHTTPQNAFGRCLRTGIFVHADVFRKMASSAYPRASGLHGGSCGLEHFLPVKASKVTGEQETENMRSLPIKAAMNVKLRLRSVADSSGGSATKPFPATLVAGVASSTAFFGGLVWPWVFNTQRLGKRERASLWTLLSAGDCGGGNPLPLRRSWPLLRPKSAYSSKSCCRSLRPRWFLIYEQPR